MDRIVRVCGKRPKREGKERRKRGDADRLMWTAISVIQFVCYYYYYYSVL